MKMLTVLALVALLAQQQPIFRSGTTVVEVTVIVRDRAGAFVRGLTADDFVVTEEGRPQRIESVYLVERPDPTGAKSSDAVAAGRTFVFFFDLDQLSPGSLTRARDAVKTFASSSLTPSDTSGIVTAGIANNVSITNNHAATAKVAASVRPRGERLNRDRELREWPRILNHLEAAQIARNDEAPIIKARDRACEERGPEFVCIGDSFEAQANRNQVESELRRKSQQFVLESRVAAEATLTLLAETAKALEGTRGRKTLVWFTEGAWPEELGEKARASAQRASQSGVAVYAVDPRGLGGGDRSIDNVGPEEVGTAFLNDLSDLSNLMAAGTGGRFIRNNTRIDRVLREIDDDTSSYYVIAYASDRAETRGRPVSVKLTKPALASARIRHGFMAPQHGKSVVTTHAEAAGASTLAAFSEAAIGAPALPPRPDHVERVKPHVESAPRAAVDGAASRGWDAYQRGDLEVARTLFEQAAASSTPPAWALHALGFTYMAAGDATKALEAWERARRIAPEYRDLYLDLAAVYTQLSDVSEALSVLRDGEKRWPGEPEIQNGIGVLMVRRGALDQAIDAFRKASAAAPDDALTHLNLGRVYEMRYSRSRRYVANERVWMGPKADLDKAIESYARSAKLGGPHAQAAAEALSRLQWSKSQ